MSIYARLDVVATNIMSLESCHLAISSGVTVSFPRVGVPAKASRTKLKCLVKEIRVHSSSYPSLIFTDRSHCAKPHHEVYLVEIQHTQTAKSLLVPEDKSSSRISKEGWTSCLKMSSAKSISASVGVCHVICKK
jgi:hypothetical protein